MENIIEDVKKIINEYYVREFGEDSAINNEVLYDNIKDLGIAYTTYEDENEEIYEVQVSTNVLNKSVLTYIDGNLIETYVYDNWNDYKDYLQHLDFDEQIGVAIDLFNNMKEVCENE